MACAAAPSACLRVVVAELAPKNVATLVLLEDLLEELVREVDDEPPPARDGTAGVAVPAGG